MSVPANIRLIFVATALLCGTAEASLFTIRSSGTIERGFDGLGIFGTAGENLAGSNFVFTYSWDTTNVTRFGSDYNYTFADGIAKIAFSASINGATYSSFIDAGHPNNDAGIYNYVTTRGPNRAGSDQVYTFIFGLDRSGYKVNSQQIVYSYYNAFVGPVPNFSAAFQYAPKPEDTAISFLNISEATGDEPNNSYFYTKPRLFEINSVSADVPEPGVLSMFLLGLFTLGRFVRRRKHAGPRAILPL
ncbi:PEP-CTERM sorting domain-containing protein [Massilia psychrophila]|uniref:PEP-CTERM protein-sorting domain-containing protein n=1 Tax=Massilia psychrophila TaxID=1603353 RepID=A0A2G8SZQ2_9BURK|nr:PEP-CTERM sorting domain-containing protein [Massilia psychrophila]PIL39193.1 hypothetical protein CR103_13985 [Massilia psychrophila]GGE82160.1 hypothetical protein GCM10008020_28860 [Massilia psychrophila]